MLRNLAIAPASVAGSTLVNLCPNGSAEHDTTGTAEPAGWTTTGTHGFGVAAATFTGSIGSHVMEMPDSSGVGLTQTGQATMTTGSAVSPSTSYEATAAFQQLSSSGGSLTIGISWYDNTNTLISTSTGSAGASGAANSTGTISVTATAPSNAVTAKLVVSKGFDTTHYYVDAINFAPTSQGTTYHDGDSGGGWTWTGTVGNSTSQNASATVRSGVSNAPQAVSRAALI